MAPRAPTTTAVPVMPATALEMAAAPPPLPVAPDEPDDPVDPFGPVPIVPDAPIGPFIDVGDLEGDGATTVPLLLSTKIGGFNPDANPPEAPPEAIGPANPREVTKDWDSAAFALVVICTEKERIRAKNNDNLILGAPNLALSALTHVFFTAPLTGQGRLVCA